MSEAYRSEEEFWSRKTRVNRLRECVKNTKYFHVVIAERRKRNRMKMIKPGDRTECKSEERIVGG